MKAKRMTWGLGVSLVILTVSLVSAAKIDRSSFKKVSFALLSGFDYPYPGPQEIREGKIKATIPSEVLALNKEKIAVDGFMMPVTIEEDEKVTEFFLVKDMASCCFGGPPALNGWIQVTMNPGSWADFSQFVPITVYGKLEVGANVLDGQLPTVYRMKGEYVETSEDFEMDFTP